MAGTCPSVDPNDGLQCGFPKGHYGKCGNGIGHRTWDYNNPVKETIQLGGAGLIEVPIKKEWTHSICEECWNKINPNRMPVRFKKEALDRVMCCYCGKTHHSGIYVRADQSELLCQGKIGIHFGKEEK